mmetsp:Transcript_11503/g.16664  ORF Transcript_11503/g.16664 Transcript_11503/m.16664 type:complete len:647 (-) Transcript_11503:241-2181(-)|eukprot:CAMPEP_0195527828 /NCGR_PEP_ID=MMETSP0794_2-20130614/29746_1 /TAXON_ID=515487 /ORGANISM="Stephanopyxis turris, Strain CCMP 815" /LENGTH=646 /DNA_ID=CAMNT_0040658829 /DNA_START=181 /DNA_END=2121 /DNA_ORIENTATION=+
MTENISALAADNAQPDSQDEFSATGNPYCSSIKSENGISAVASPVENKGECTKLENTDGQTDSITSTNDKPSDDSTNSIIVPAGTREEQDRVLRRFATLLGSMSQQGNPGIHMSPGINSSLVGSAASNSSSSATELKNMLVNDSTTICELPCVDLTSGEALDLAVLTAAPGEAPKKFSGNSATTGANPTSHNQPGIKVPVMAASVFGGQPQMGMSPKMPQSMYTPPPLDSINKTQETPGVASLPKNEHGNYVDPPAEKQTLEKVAAKILSEPVLWTRSSSPQAPSAFLSSLSSSFSSLIQARMKSWTMILIRHALKSGDEEGRTRLLSLLATSGSINSTAVVTKFQALKLPKEFASENKPGEIILPLIFESVTDIELHGRKLKIRLRAPGTINGTFADPLSFLLKRVCVNLDMKALLKSLVEHARFVVFRAVSTSTSIPAGLVNPVEAPWRDSVKSVQSADDALDDEEDEGSAPISPLKSFASIKLDSKYSRTGPAAAPTLGKIKTSRSVSFDTQLTHRVDTASQMGVSKLRSSKSFGKPDANTFECQRNATFADFGRGLDMANSLNKNSNMTSDYTTVQDGVKSRNASFSFLAKMKGMNMANMAVARAPNIGSSNPPLDGSPGMGMSRSPQLDAFMRAQKNRPNI